MDKPNSKKFKPARVWFAGLNSALGNFIYSYNLGVFTSSQPSVSATLNWGEDSNRNIAIITSFNPLGSLFGSMLSGYLSKFIGHRKNIMTADLILIISSIITIIPYTLSFAIGRFLSGVAGGCFCVLSPLYLNEISPAEISGRVGSLMMIMSCIASTLAFGLALMLPTENYETDSMNNFWIFMFFFQSFVAILQMILFSSVFKQESPFWLLSKGLIKKSLESLKYTYNGEYAEEVLEKVKNRKKTSFNDSWKAIRLGIIINVLQQLSGINAILSYTTTLFAEYGSDVFTARLFTMLTGLVRLLASLSNLLILDSIGRKRALVIGTIVMGLCLGGMSLCSTYPVHYLIPITIVQIYLAVFVMSSGSVCWIYCGEMLSDKGMSICSTINFLSNFIIVLIFPFVKAAFGYTSTFLALAVCNIFGAIYLQYEMIETKGMLKAEIQSQFSKPNQN